MHHRNLPPGGRYGLDGTKHFDFSDYGAYLTAFADHITQNRPEPLLTTRTPGVTVLHTHT